MWTCTMKLAIASDRQATFRLWVRDCRVEIGNHAQGRVKALELDQTRQPYCLFWSNLTRVKIDDGIWSQALFAVGELVDQHFIAIKNRLKSRLTEKKAL